jgi:hypothetical protein
LNNLFNGLNEGANEAKWLENKEIRRLCVRASFGKGPLRDFKTGTGFARAKLSEILPAARVARFVRMTRAADNLVQDAYNRHSLGSRAPA